MFPAPYYEDSMREYMRATYPQAEELHLRTPDGLVLGGWLVKAETAGRAPALIYFSGNGEMAEDFPINVAKLRTWSLLLVNYRGYGANPGKPTEQALFADALLLYDTLLQRRDVDPDRIVAMGRSLGSGVAVDLALHRKLRAVVLATPYDSMRSVAQAKFPYLPVSLLLKHPFDSLSKAPVINVPALLLVAGRDTLIPPPHAERLAAAWGGPKRVHVFPDADHDTIYGESQLWVVLRGFLEKQR